MGIEDDIKELVKAARGNLREMKKGIIILKEADEDVTRQQADYDRLKKRIEGFERGLKKVE